MKARKIFNTINVTTSSIPWLKREGSVIADDKYIKKFKTLNQSIS